MRTLDDPTQFGCIEQPSSAHAAEPPSSAYAGCPFKQELPVSPGIIDAIVQRVTNAVPQQRLASIRSTNMISTFPLLYPPCMKPLSRQNPMQYPGTKLVDQLTLLPML